MDIDLGIGLSIVADIFLGYDLRYVMPELCQVYGTIMLVIIKAPTVKQHFWSREWPIRWFCPACDNKSQFVSLFWALDAPVHQTFLAMHHGYGRCDRRGREESYCVPALATVAGRRRVQRVPVRTLRSASRKSLENYGKLASQAGRTQKNK